MKYRPQIWVDYYNSKLLAEVEANQREDELKLDLLALAVGSQEELQRKIS